MSAARSENLSRSGPAVGATFSDGASGRVNALGSMTRSAAPAPACLDIDRVGAASVSSGRCGGCGCAVAAGASDVDPVSFSGSSFGGEMSGSLGSTGGGSEGVDRDLVAVGDAGALADGGVVEISSGGRSVPTNSSAAANPVTAPTIVASTKLIITPAKRACDLFIPSFSRHTLRGRDSWNARHGCYWCTFQRLTGVLRPHQPLTPLAKNWHGDEVR